MNIHAMGKGYPWFWVRRSLEEKKDSPSANHMQLTEKAYTIRQDLIERCQRIADDDTIPVRKSKARPMNKAACRQEVHDDIHQKLRELAIELGVLDGKVRTYFLVEGESLLFHVPVVVVPFG